MKAVRICVCALAMLVLLAQCAVSDPIWTEQKIAENTSHGGPVIWDGAVYWSDVREYSNGYLQLTKWTEQGGEQILAQVPLYTRVTAAYGEKLVCERYVGPSNYDLYTWDPVNGERPLAVGPGSQAYADIWGDTIVWMDSRSGVYQVYAWDPVNGERAVASTGYGQYYPRVWGDTVVWEDSRPGASGVYAWDAVNGARLIGSGKTSPAIYGDKVVMFCPHEDYYMQGSRMWEYSLTTRSFRDIALVSGRSVSFPRVYGDLVVWGTGDSMTNILAWDPVHGQTRVNQSDIGSAGLPSLYGRSVAWRGPSGLRVTTIVPEPSGVCALALGLMGACGPLLRRRRRTRGREEERQD